MNEGVRILIGRMRECPDDFRQMMDNSVYVTRMNPWLHLHSLVMNGNELFTDDERTAVKNATIELKRTLFTSLVLDTLSGKLPDVVEELGSQIVNTWGNLTTTSNKLGSAYIGAQEKHEGSPV